MTKIAISNTYFAQLNLAPGSCALGRSACENSDSISLPKETNKCVVFLKKERNSTSQAKPSVFFSVANKCVQIDQSRCCLDN